MEVHYIYVFGIRFWSDSFYMILIWILVIAGSTLFAWYIER